MRLKIKALGLGCLAVLASGALVLDAAATTGGHFTSNRANTDLEAILSNHKMEFKSSETAEAISCEEGSYLGNVTGNTFTAFTLTPTYKGCRTTDGAAGSVTVAPNGCTYQFTIRTEPATKHSTWHLNCPAGQKLTITHPSCTIMIPPQTLTGITYQKGQYLGTPTITINFTASVQYNMEAGACVFLGTTQAGTFTGALDIKGWEQGQKPTVGADILAT